MTMKETLKWIFSGKLTTCSTCGGKIIRGDRILRVIYRDYDKGDGREDILCGACGDFAWRSKLEREAT